MSGQKHTTASEVLGRNKEMALLRGATYGRLQSELLAPLINKAADLLGRKPEDDD